MAVAVVAVAVAVVDVLVAASVVAAAVGVAVVVRLWLLFLDNDLRRPNVDLADHARLLQTP